MSRPWQVQKRACRLTAVVGLLVSLAVGAPPARARSRTRLVLRVDLATGVGKKIDEVSVGRPQPRADSSSSGFWWRRSPGGHEPELRIDVEEHDLVIRADERERLRMRLPVALVPHDAVAPLRPAWALEGDVLVLALASDTKREPPLLVGIDLGKRAISWQRSLEASAAVEAGPTDAWLSLQAVGDGRLAAWTRRSLVALEASTGTELWRQSRDVNDLVSRPSVSPMRDGGSGPAWLVSTRRLTMVDATSGGERWRLALGSGDARWCVVQGARIYLAWRTAPGKPDEKDIFAAVGTADGRVLWRAAPAPMIASGLVVGGDGGDALVTWSPSGLDRVDPNTGQRLWHLPDAGPTTVEILNDGDWLLPQSDCTRIDPRTGNVRWKLGSACRRLGEDRLLTVETTPRSLSQTDIVLVQRSFDLQKSLRRDVIYRYRAFADRVGCEILENARPDARGRMASLVSCDFIVLD